MALMKMPTYAGGEGGSAGQVLLDEEFTTTTGKSSTDANPTIFYGDFSSAKFIYTNGQYSTSSGYNQVGGCFEEIEFGVKKRYVAGVRSYNSGSFAPNNYGWRYITVYPDRVEIGSGGWAENGAFTANNDFGVLREVKIVS